MNMLRIRSNFLRTKSQEGIINSEFFFGKLLRKTKKIYTLVT